MTEERITPAEYLVRERAAEYRSEYRDGRMVAMTGANARHGWRDYVLIAQDRMQVERYDRDRERWRRTILDRPDALLELPALGCAVPLREIYAWVSFDSPAGPAPGS